MTAALSLSLLVDRPWVMSDAAPLGDEALVRASLDGDEEAFAEIIRRHKRRVFAAAARFARDDHQIEDIAQEVFVRAYRHLKNFRADAPFEHWLARITVSACYDFLRRERKHRETASLEKVDFDLSDASVERTVSAGRAREAITWALRQLRPEEALVLTLCELEERSVREVAELTGWSEANVKVRAYRARHALKRIFDENAHA